MNTAYGIAGLVTVAAITPGPNNFAILQIAASQGLRRAAESIAGVVAGGLVMILIGYAGLTTWIAANPRIAQWLAVFGSGYLSWLAMRLIFSPRAPLNAETLGSGKALPTGSAALFAFQFVNPKAWILVLTTASFVQASDSSLSGFAYLTLVFVAIPTVCLLIWSVFGAFIASVISSARAKTGLDMIMGLLLAASIVLIWR